MKTAKIIAWIGLFAMSFGLINGFVNGDFMADGAKLIANPWGVMSLIDLYVGFTLFSAWIIFREQKLIVSIIWTILMMALGFFIASIYILIALYTCGGDWQVFFMGEERINL